MTYKAEKKRWPVMLSAAAGGILGVTALIWARSPGDDPAAAPTPSPAAAPVLAAAAPPRVAASLPAAENSTDRSSAIALTDNQELIADTALRKVMDSYLLGGDDKGGIQALVAYLNKRLPANAARDAANLATSYNAYLSAHDQLLAAQNFGATPDLNRLISWQGQRQRLRDRMLGEKVAHEWFGNEEAYLTQALEELSQRRDGTAPPATATESVDEDQAKHDQHMQQVLRDAVVKLRPHGHGNT